MPTKLENDQTKDKFDLKISTAVCKIALSDVKIENLDCTITPEKYTDVIMYRMMKVLESVSGRKHACRFRR